MGSETADRESIVWSVCAACLNHPCERAVRLFALLKKIVGTEGISFLRFRFQIRGWHGRFYAFFNRGPNAKFCFLFIQYGFPSGAGG
jgi:hypothetical protein